MTNASVLSFLVVAYTILASSQLLAAPYDETQALGDLPKNEATVSDATSKITAAVKEGQTAIDSAVNTAKSALDAAGADQTAINDVSLRSTWISSVQNPILL
ncbi:hypothetical protein DdX_09232 [Ditylenchus destructor]|uniref:Uncharacterized protein n=1 Tax=Ditylenchus destructor TaxID=166010 RepID=A0AAD4N470_9BILA|nr:hypothetical protein DdX_09232 [Ditylenchus destructor]